MMNPIKVYDTIDIEFYFIESNEGTKLDRVTYRMLKGIHKAWREPKSTSPCALRK